MVRSDGASGSAAAGDVGYGAFRRVRYFAALDGLRALSILAVIWHHAVDSSGPWGFAGVSLFFAISGFLITTLLLREREATGDISLRNFYVRRSLRIFPLYYAVLALYVALSLLTDPRSTATREFFSNLPYFATYTSNLFVGPGEGGRTVFYFAWSLATEEQFYLLWPCVVRFSRGWRVPAAVLAVVIVGGEVARALPAAGTAASTFLMRLAAINATPICLGCLAAYGAHSPRVYGVLRRAVGGSWAAPVLLLGAGWVTALGVVAVPVQFALFVLVVVACCLREDHRAAPLLSSATLRAVGAVSYGMYMLHMLGLNAVRRAVPAAMQSTPVLFLCTAALAFVAAQVSFRSYERWFLRLKDRFRVPAPAPSAVDGASGARAAGGAPSRAIPPSAVSA